jgi:hypothetical protein
MYISNIVNADILESSTVTKVDRWSVLHAFAEHRRLPACSKYYGAIPVAWLIGFARLLLRDFCSMEGSLESLISFTRVFYGLSWPTCNELHVPSRQSQPRLRRATTTM